MPDVGGHYADIHSHLVPDVDDGARSVAESLDALDRMVGFGVQRIVTTPHLRGSDTRNTAMLDFMERRWAKVAEAAKTDFSGLDFRCGYEIRLDTPDPDLSDPRLRLGGTPFILVEWPMFRVPPETSGVLGRIRQKGCVPVIAHPERYDGIDDSLGIVRAWKEAGACLQGNYGSVVGQYGPAAQTMALRMLSAGLLDYLASDFHGRANYRLYIEPSVKKLARLGGKEQVALLAKTNPARLFDGQSPLPVPPLDAAAPCVPKTRARRNG